MLQSYDKNVIDVLVDGIFIKCKLNKNYKLKKYLKPIKFYPKNIGNLHTHNWMN